MISEQIKASRKQIRRLLTMVREKINDYTEEELQDLTTDLFKYV